MDIKSRAILAVVFLLSLLTLKGARRLGHFIGWFALVTKGGMYKVSQKNISLCLPELSVEEQEKLIHESLIHTGCQIAETGLAWGGSKRQRDINRQCVTVCNEQILVIHRCHVKRLQKYRPPCTFAHSIFNTIDDSNQIVSIH